MKVIDEFECPNCKKTMQKLQIRRPSLICKEIRHKRGGSLKYYHRKGIYKFIVKKEMK